MEIRINKNLLLPIAIIFIALLVGGIVLLSDKPKQQPVVSSPQTEKQPNKAVNTQQISANARKLEVSVPGMFCAGCKASVEGYLFSVPGIEYVEARLTPRKSATIIYNPDKITKEQIVKNQIFDTYGPATIISDEKFQGSVEQLNKTQTNLPPSIQEKTNRVSQLLIQKQQAGVTTNVIQEQLYEVNSLLQTEQYQKAEELLDSIIKELENVR